MNKSVVVPLRLNDKIDSLVANLPPKTYLNATQKSATIADIKRLLKVMNATLVAHYYVEEELQDLTDATGGIVADSLEMANFGSISSAEVLVVLGVRFMGETAKILNPEKTVLMPTLEANCSLDIGCPADEFAKFKAENPEHTVVVYANTSAEVKAMADWVVTSSNALAIARHLKANNEKILWAPDRHLGNWIEKETGIEMVRWDGSCLVHNEFKVDEIACLKERYPEAKIIVHPESPADVIAIADVVGSTKVLLKTVVEDSAEKFIVATDAGIFHKMQQKAPAKKLYRAPTETDKIRCVACGLCPWMGMNGLHNLHQALLNRSPEIKLAPEIITNAKTSINRMLDFSKQCAII